MLDHLSFSHGQAETVSVIEAETKLRLRKKVAYQEVCLQETLRLLDDEQDHRHTQIQTDIDRLQATVRRLHIKSDTLFATDTYQRGHRQADIDHIDHRYTHGQADIDQRDHRDTYRQADIDKRDHHPTHRQADINQRDHHPIHRQADIDQRDHHPTHRQADINQTDHRDTYIQADIDQRDYNPTHRQADINQRDYNPIHRQADINQRDHHPTHRQADISQRDYNPIHRQADINQRNYNPIHRQADINQRDYHPTHRQADIDRQRGTVRHIKPDTLFARKIHQRGIQQRTANTEVKVFPLAPRANTTGDKVTKQNVIHINQNKSFVLQTIARPAYSENLHYSKIKRNLVLAEKLGNSLRDRYEERYKQLPVRGTVNLNFLPDYLAGLYEEQNRVTRLCGNHLMGKWIKY